MREIVNGCNRFALDLYSQIAGTPGNRIFSPSSISMALAMAYAGASGQTAREMAEVLQFSLPPEQVHEGFRQLREGTRTGGVELQIANRLWGQRGYKFLPEFLETTERCYGARLGELDFRANAEAARVQINAWVEEQTARRIQNLVPPGSLDEMTRLVLTNAIYFLGCWQSEFNERWTKDAPFFDGTGASVTVPLMYQMSRFGYSESDECQVLELTYRSEAARVCMVRRNGTECLEIVEDPSGGSDFAMYIVLPRRVDGLPEIEARLTSSSLSEWLTLHTRLVDVWMPKFKLECDLSLGNILEAMGMGQAFSLEHADFSETSDDPEGLFVSEVLHRAMVDVNEKGTEAAAGTVVRHVGGSAHVETDPRLFRADHPFLFLIRDRSTELIHFMGCVENPVMVRQ